VPDPVKPERAASLLSSSTEAGPLEPFDETQVYMGQAPKELTSLLQLFMPLHKPYFLLLRRMELLVPER